MNEHYIKCDRVYPEPVIIKVEIMVNFQKKIKIHNQHLVP